MKLFQLFISPYATALSFKSWRHIHRAAHRQRLMRHPTEIMAASGYFLRAAIIDDYR